MTRSAKALDAARQIVEDCLREGYFPPDIPSKGRGAHTEAIKRLGELYGLPRSTAGDWIRECGADYSLFRPYQYAALKYGVKELPAYRPNGPVIPEGDFLHVGIIGDAHDSPELPDKSRFEQMGAWVNDMEFDKVVQIGDFLSLDSLTRHAAPGTKNFAELPSFKQDLDSLEDALTAFDRGLGDWNGDKIITLGNHEYRANIYEDNNPQLTGTIVSQLHYVFESHGWRLVPYGEIIFLNGVGLTHAATNAMGKPYGGKTADQRAGGDSTFSLIHGHTHARVIAPSAKIGPMGHVDMISVGCSLPWGHVESYAKHGPSGWWWGVSSALLRAGQITDMNFMSMLDLEYQYGTS